VYSPLIVAGVLWVSQRNTKISMEICCINSNTLRFIRSMDLRVKGKHAFLLSILTSSQIVKLASVFNNNGTGFKCRVYVEQMCHRFTTLYHTVKECSQSDCDSHVYEFTDTTVKAE
jgi:hypothetical protein